MDTSEKRAGERVAGAARPVLAAMARGTPKVTLEDVDDLTSVVVVKVLDQLAQGKVIDDLEMYAKAVARNAFYGHVRRRGVNLTLAPAGGPDATDDTDWLEGMGRALGSVPHRRSR